MIAHPSAITRRLQCAEVWGGICDRDEDVACPGLSVSMYSSSADGDRCGGDIHYLSVCNHGLMTRAVLADVAGHGRAASDLSRWLYEALADNVDRLDNVAVLGGVNRLAATRGGVMTTAAIVTYYQTDHSLRIAIAGHPPPLVCRGGRTSWEPLAVRSTRPFSNPCACYWK